MFKSDLSQFIDASGYLTPNCIAVGWLSAGHGFLTGPTSAEFRRKLRVLCEHPVRKMRGHHVCELCASDKTMGNGEVHIHGSGGEIFITPVMVSHYVDVHNYHPPESFIAAVESSADESFAVGECELSERIQAFLQMPTLENRNAFYATLLVSRVGIRVPAKSRFVLSGDYVTKDSELSIPTTMSYRPNPCKWLVVLADVQQHAKREKGSIFADFKISDVIKWALSADAGLIVETSLPNRYALVDISKEDLCRLGVP